MSSSFREYKVDTGPFSGTYGEVFICSHETLGFKRAIKRLHPFVRPAIIEDEAQKLKDVSSPYVMQVFDFFGNENVLVMEYCPVGFDDYLADRLHQTKSAIPYDEAAELLRGILQGLNDAHKAGIIHGDVKPGNVRFGADSLPKLCDFGAARRVREETGLLKGSSSWMAPEVLRGGAASAEADYFSFGALAYLTLVGRHPYYADDPTCLSREDDNILSDTFHPQHLLQLRDDIPRPVADLVMELLSREPSRRMRAEEALKAALASTPEEAEPARPGERRGATEAMSDEELIALRQAYTSARYSFFHDYVADDAVEIMTGYLDTLDMTRFACSGLDELADCWSLLGFIKNSQGQFVEAEQAATEGLRIREGHVSSLHTRGYAQFQQRNYLEALADLQLALDLANTTRKRDQLSGLLAATKERIQTAEGEKLEQE